ncbi:galactose-3-O-sulfotransferase 2 [Megalops cyprinoides]|uniref:galactose-3-O-sulfotransferase 2 n=1 Tax=Megalops cyprinoides TaxID=118141 RepID=UPI001864EF37|nr:galactose-3-O-sulfotransferase 2 [Megalops cyprinoides]
MTFHRLPAQIWKHRVTVLLVALAITLLLMLLATHSLQRNRSTNLVADSWWRKPAPKVHNEHGASHAITPAASKAREGHTPRLPSPSIRQGRPAGRKRRGLPPIVFLKTHKTGSSTVQNLLFRLGERESATFAFPRYTYQFGYPERFRAEFVEELPAGSSQFDVLCSQLRLDVGQLRRLMPRNAVYVTLLRDPVRTFESVFGCYASNVPAFFLAQKAARGGAPSEGKSALSVFLEAPETFWDPSEAGNCLARNPMSFDLGLDSREWSDSWPESLARLEEAFQLVMIAEHFDESLVLLKELLRLQPEDLAYVRLNTRAAGDVAPLDEETSARIRAWNSLDVLLYDFFLQVFWERAERFGLERLQREAAHLRDVAERVRRRCLAREGVAPRELGDLIRPLQSNTATILGYELWGNLTEEEQGICVRLVLPELQYHSYLYFQQYGHDMRAVPTD